MFPNEIFAIVLQNLADDLPSLRNVALACKDFCAMAQPHIFQEIGLRDSSGAIDEYKCRVAVNDVETFLQSSKILQFIRRIYVTHKTPYFGEPNGAARMLSSFPALNSFTVFYPAAHLICAMESSPLAATLKVLCIDCLHVDSRSLTLLGNMLVSLRVLKILAMSDVLCDREDCREIVLPRSLKVLSLRTILPRFLTNVGLGMESSPPHSLEAVILSMLAPSDCKGLWSSFGARTQIVFEKDVFHSSDILSLRGFVAQKLIWIWEQQTVHRYPFYEEALGECSVGRERDWAGLDRAFVERHELGMLTRVCFRCTNRAEFFDFDPRIRAFDVAEDRSILDDVERLLPKSKSISGFLEVDFEMKDFVPS
ncbi:hypothetical protein D9757_003603 [Collybiopsis confluens]|uniref:F-box domain-containing protein n=1 Tax=Collybiopsis confluens TaxID=2823264 RepID=A0A8H5MDI7_9AGAR|nr:hypothetical protein D9757_003603 [Collybiopsis confluens]